MDGRVKSLYGNRNTWNSEQARDTKPESSGRSNRVSPKAMALNYDNEESPLKALGLWSPMEHSGHAKDFHTIMWVKGNLPITICDGKDNRHIRVPGFWFLRPCIVQGE